MSKMAIRCKITGRVQGVWFRGGCREEAEKLGLTGWVKNTTDRSVELEVEGERDKLALFKEWLWQGPALSRVENVFVQEIPLQNYEEFIIR